jgi:hypothetical protein
MDSYPAAHHPCSFNLAAEYFMSVIRFENSILIYAICGLSVDKDYIHVPEFVGARNMMLKSL